MVRMISLLVMAIISFAPSVTAFADGKGAPEVSQAGNLPFGEYLAGRHAAIHHDIRSAANFHEQALILDPDNELILRKSFGIFISDGRYDQALKSAHKLTSLNIEDSMVKMFLFLEKAKAKDFEGALVDLDKIGAAGVYSLFKPLFRAWVLVANGQAQEAEAVIETLLKTVGFKDFKQYHAGLIYDHLGKTELAEKMYSASLIVPGPVSLRAVEAYGGLLQRLDRKVDARQLYLNYLEKAPDNARLLRALQELDNNVLSASFINRETDGIAEIFHTAANFLMQDNIRLAATIYLRYANYLKADFALVDFMLGQVFESDKYYEGALDSYGRLGKNHPLYFRAQVQMAWTLEKMDRLEEAFAAMKKLSVEFSGNREIYATLGDIYRIHRRFDEAVLAYTKYIDSLTAITENHWSIFYTRGIVLEQSQQWQRAEADLLKALELRPDHPQVLNYLAYSWVDKGMNIEKARVMLEKAVELRPNDGFIRDSLGWALYRMGDMPKAVEHLERALQMQSDDWAINDHLGDAYWAVGRKYEAKFQWRHALSLKPDEDLIEKIKRKLEDGPH